MKKAHIILHNGGFSSKTLIEELENQLNLFPVSMHDLFRELLSSNTELSISVKNYLDNGKLVPEFLVNQIIFEGQDKINGDFQLVRYPRTKKQFNSLRKFFADRNIIIEHLWFLKLQDINQFIKYKKDEINPYTEKFSLAEERLRKNHEDCLNDFHDIYEEINDDKMVSIIPVNYPIEDYSEDIKKSITLYKNHLLRTL